MLQSIGLPVDELGEIAVTDKQILLFLAMDSYANGFILTILFFYFFYLLSLLFRT